MATEIGKAYVQVVPTTKNIKSELESQMSGGIEEAGKSSGKKFGSSMISKIKTVIVAAGIGTIVKEALSAGGDLQQSFGGLDTIYGEASEAAKKYASEASKAGISANDYAEQAVSFGASLKQAFSGDTKKAVEAANTAIMDMTDNAAKMGTPMENIQNAYQGFAKQNYTMLDNLKLGYGGTKEEMNRLLSDAQKLSGVEYDISNLGDVYSAIHVIQEDLGLTGVAAQEAATTFTGSMGAMKADATNVMAALSTGGDIKGTISSLIQSTSTFVFQNLFPMIGNIIKSIPVVINTFLTEGIPTIVESGSTIISSLIGGITESLPDVLTSAESTVSEFLGYLTEHLPDIMDQGISMITNLANGVLKNLPAMITSIGNIITSFIKYIGDNFPTIMKKGFELIKNLALGIIKNLPAIITSIVKVIGNIISTIGKNLPKILKAGVDILVEIGKGIVNAIPKLINKVGSVITNIKESFKKIDWKKLGIDILTGIGKGIVSAVSNVVKTAKEAAGKIFDAVKEFFAIGSPSRLMRDEIGKWIPAGIAVGIEGNMDSVTNAMDDLTNQTLKASVNGLDYSAKYGESMATSESTLNDKTVELLAAILSELSNQEIVLDTGALVGAIAKKMDKALGDLYLKNQKGVLA